MSQKISFTNGYAGFTMVELMVTLAIAAIVTAFAIPALRDFVLNNRSAAFLNEFVVAANSARAEAVKRGAPVTLCSSSNPTAQNPTCDGGGIWETAPIQGSDYDGEQCTTISVTISQNQ